MSLILLTGFFPNLLTAQTDRRAENILAQMSLSEKVGQLFMIGFPQSKMDEKLRSHIQKNHLGSFLLFKRNIQDLNHLKALTKALQNTGNRRASLNSLVAVDQEGGFVSRLTLRPPAPHAFAVGLSKSPSLAESFGDEIGRILASFGFNMNLAPVLDLADPQKKSFISTRSFGKDPVLVGSMVSAYSRGLLKQKVIPTAKHFPGLGDLTADPHTSSVQRSEPIKELLSRDFLPFREFSQLGEHSAIMLSHIVYPSLDETKTPASFSSRIIKYWLRQEIGYQGVVITDDLQMKSSTEKHGVAEGVIRALEAGVDMLMLSWSFQDQEKSIRAVLRAYEKNQLSVSDLDEKVLRILRLKLSVTQNEELSLALRSPSSQTEIFSENLEKIHQQILESKLAEMKEASATWPQGVLCVYASNPQFLRSLQLQLKRPYRAFQLRGTLKPKSLDESLKRNNCSINILTIYDRSQARQAIELSPSMKTKTFVLNFGSVAFLRNSDRFLEKIDLLISTEKSAMPVADFFNQMTAISRSKVRVPLGPVQSRVFEDQIYLPRETGWPKSFLLR